MDGEAGTNNRGVIKISDDWTLIVYDVPLVTLTHSVATSVVRRDIVRHRPVRGPAAAAVINHNPGPD